MLKSTGAIGFALLLLAAVSGCGQQSVQATSTSRGNRPPIDKKKYVLDAQPDGAVGVIIAREDAKDQDDIVLVGRIGGCEKPWIEGRSAFVVIDASVSVVAGGQGTEEGQICMDDCCALQRAECTTLVKVVDDHGKPLAIDTRELLDVKENDMVVVKGKVQRHDKDAFTVAASGVYVRR